MGGNIISDKGNIISFTLCRLEKGRGRRNQPKTSIITIAAQIAAGLSVKMNMAADTCRIVKIVDRQ